MVLRCDCGGAVELTSQSYGERTAVEEYECMSCGRTGTYLFDEATESMTGCLTTEAY